MLCCWRTAADDGWTARVLKTTPGSADKGTTTSSRQGQHRQERQFHFLVWKKELSPDCHAGDHPKQADEKKNHKPM